MKSQKRIAILSMGALFGLIAGVVAIVVIYHDQQTMGFAEMAMSFIVTYTIVAFIIIVIAGIVMNMKVDHFLGNTKTEPQAAVTDPA